MNQQQRAEIQKALEAMQFALHVGFDESSESQIKKGDKAGQQHRAAITALRQLLEQPTPVQEPVEMREVLVKIARFLNVVRVYAQDIQPKNELETDKPLHWKARELQDEVIRLLDTTPQAQPAPVQEPLFWYRPCRDGMYEGPVHNNSVGGKMLRDEKPNEWKPLFTTPQAQPADLNLNCKSVQARLATQWGYVKREWVGLTDEERRKLFDPLHDAPFEFAKRIESKLKEKNT